MRRLEPEGEAERPEATVPWNGVDGIGKVKAATGRYGQKSQGRKENIKQKMEEKVDGKAPSEERAEIQSPKRKVIRVESKETDDDAREPLNLSRDESEEMSFVPSAISIPHRPMF